MSVIAESMDLIIIYKRVEGYVPFERMKKKVLTEQATSFRSR